MTILAILQAGYVMRYNVCQFQYFHLPQYLYLTDVIDLWRKHKSPPCLFHITIIPCLTCSYFVQVKMSDKDTDEELTFTCRRWLARDEDDFEICRELPAVRKGEPILPGCRARVPGLWTERMLYRMILRLFFGLQWCGTVFTWLRETCGGLAPRPMYTWRCMVTAATRGSDSSTLPARAASNRAK